jgi:hypothetical protein
MGGVNLFDILDGLERVLPILGGLTGNPAIGTLAAKLLQIAEDEIRRRQASTGQTRSEILADAENTFIEAKLANERLKQLGHENDPA